MRIRRMWNVLALLLVLLLSAVPAIAQVSNATAALRGTVVDEQGKAVPNATVTVTNTATDLSKIVTTGGDGAYQVLPLNPGTYRVEVAATGFEKQVATNVVLTIGQLAVYDAHLRVGALSTVVEVTGNAVPLIDTEQTQQANNITEDQVEELPNINRTFNNTVYTLPGVSNSDAPRAQTAGFTGFFTTGFSIGGSNGRNNLSTIDGGENEYGTGQYRVPTFPNDDVQELQVNRNAFAAEFGFTDGAAINVVSKSGGNAFHGDAFGEFRDRYTNAQSYFYGVEHATDPTFSTQPYSQNVYGGGTLGGPLVKDKLFFSVTYEGQKVDAADPVPLRATCEVQGLNYRSVGLTAAQCPTQAAQQKYLNAVNTFFGPGNPLGASLQAAFTPLSNPGYAQIVANNNGTFDVGTRFNNVIGRLDFVPNSKDSFMLRLGYARNNYIFTGADAPTLRVRDYSVLFRWAHTFSSAVVNQMIFQGVPWNRANTTQPDTGSTNEILVGTGPNGGGLLFAGTSSYYPYLAHQHRIQGEDNVTWTSGPHTIKFGGDLKFADYHVSERLWMSGQYVFVGGFPTIFAAAPAVQGLDFFFNSQPFCAAAMGQSCMQLGLPLGPASANPTASNMMVANAPFNWEQGFGNPSWQGWGKYIGLFLQDTWKVTRHFTLTPGVRFDYDGEPLPLHGHSYPSPRLGFAWDLMGNQKTVIRGGGGIYASPIDVLVPSYAALLSGNGQYLNVLGSQTFPQLTGLGLPPSPAQAIWTAGVVGNAAAGIAPNTIPLGQLTGTQITKLGFPTAANTPGQTNQVIYNGTPNYTYPRSIEASFSIEQELMQNLSLSVAYDFYHALHQQMPVETAYGLVNCATGASLGANPTPAQLAAAALPVVGNCYAPSLGGSLTNPNVTERTTYESIGNSVYHGLTASLTKRYSHGLLFQANYTWSKAIDNFIDFASFQEWYRPQQLGLYRGISAFNVPQRFVFNAVYSTPHSAEGVLGALYRNASIAPVVSLQSGLPFTLLTQSLPNGPFGAAGTDIPGEDGNSAWPIGEKRDSNSGRPFYSWDMTLRKGFSLMSDERLKLDFNVQFINLLNRENFNFVANNIPCNSYNPAAPTTCVTTAALAGGQLVNLASLSPKAFEGIHGVKPTNSNQFNKPGFYSPAGGLFGGANYIPRQVQFGLRLTF